jgi:phospholipid/cholesterol/gamma-HCH transport system substrate-binding protein
MENRSHALMTGIFTLVLLVATVLAGIWFNRDRTERLPYEIATTQAISGLNPQAAVRYRGLEVGKVDEIIFDPNTTGQVLIHMSVDKDAPVTSTTFAKLGYQGVTGIASVDLDDEKTGSPRLATSAQRIARVPLRQGFLDQLEKRGLVILEKAEKITTSIDAMLNEENQKKIVGAFDKVGRAADAIEAIPKQLEPTLARLPALTGKVEDSLASFNQLSTSTTKMVRNYDQLATALQAPDGPVNRLNATVDRVGGSLEAVTSELEMQTLPHLVNMADEARTSLRAVRRTADTLSNRPQSLLFGTPNGTPGPGEAGFVAPTK